MRRMVLLRVRRPAEATDCNELLGTLPHEPVALHVEQSPESIQRDAFQVANVETPWPLQLTSRIEQFDFV